MENFIQPPSLGSPIRAAWAAQVTGAINSLGVCGASGTLVRDGAGAFGHAPLPPNMRDRHTVVAHDIGCYRIEPSTDETTGEIVHVFGNPYVMLGDMIARRPVLITLEQLLQYAGYEEGEEKEGVKHLFLALRILARPQKDESESDKIVGYGTFDELVAAQRELEHHTIPLYFIKVTETETDEGGKGYSWSIACDFRRSVYGQQMEVLP